VSKAQCNELDRSVQFSSVQFSAVYWTGDELRRPATAVAGSWQSRTGDGRRRSSQLVAGFHPTTDIALIGRFTDVSRLWRTYDDRRFRRRIVAARRRFNAQRETQLNWTVQLSWVEFSTVSRCALGFRPKYIISLLLVCDFSMIYTYDQEDLNRHSGDQFSQAIQLSTDLRVILRASLWLIMRPTAMRPHNALYTVRPSVGPAGTVKARRRRPVRPGRTYGPDVRVICTRLNLKTEPHATFKLWREATHVRTNWQRNFDVRRLKIKVTGAAMWKSFFAYLRESSIGSCKTKTTITRSVRHVSCSTMQQRKCVFF